jgi:hypothetical protein
MKRTIAPTTFVIGFAIAFVLGIPPGAQAGEPRECSNASLHGGFGFTSSGTLNALPPPSAGTFGEIGRQTFDGEGNTDGTATLTANGNLRRVTWQGTYVVNPDCTGSMTLFVAPFGATVNLDFVIDADETELRAISTGPTGTGAIGNVETRVYKKQFSRGRKEK